MSLADRLPGQAMSFAVEAFGRPPCDTLSKVIDAERIGLTDFFTPVRALYFEDIGQGAAYVVVREQEVDITTRELALFSEAAKADLGGENPVVAKLEQHARKVLLGEFASFLARILPSEQA